MQSYRNNIPQNNNLSYSTREFGYHGHYTHYETNMAKTDEVVVQYDTEDHLAIMTQMYASVWINVLPFCFITSALSLIIWYSEMAHAIPLSLSDRGHVFMSAMASFLVIARLSNAMRRYMEGRQLISDAMRSCRELVQNTVSFTRFKKGGQSKNARKWRSSIARRTSSLLRTVVAILQQPYTDLHVWQVPELSKSDKQAVLAAGAANERSPLVLTIFLRSVIASHGEVFEEELDCNQELTLLEYTSQFMTAYHGLMKLITTPFPFPLVQMTRTFLFVWTFSLPFALASDIDNVYALVFCVFFVTYGFIGLEFISIEIENPFGDDPNDFDVRALSDVVFSDICVMIEDIDGYKAVKRLQDSYHNNSVKDEIKNCVRSHQKLQTYGINYVSSVDEQSDPEKMSPNRLLSDQNVFYPNQNGTENRTSLRTRLLQNDVEENKPNRNSSKNYYGSVTLSSVGSGGSGHFMDSDSALSCEEKILPVHERSRSTKYQNTDSEPDFEYEDNDSNVSYESKDDDDLHGESVWESMNTESSQSLNMNTEQQRPPQNEEQAFSKPPKIKRNALPPTSMPSPSNKKSSPSSKKTLSPKRRPRLQRDHSWGSSTFDSSILSKIRQRANSDDSVEVFGTDGGKVILDSKSNTLRTLQGSSKKMLISQSDEEK